MVLLIGNYPADQQQSMQRFAQMMLRGLTAAGVPARADPAATVARPLHAWPADSSRNGSDISTSFSSSPAVAGDDSTSAVDLVHICDHSNAMYAAHVRKAPGRGHLPRPARGPRRARGGDRCARVGDREISAALDRLRPAQGDGGGLRFARHSARCGANRRPDGRPAADSCSFITASIILTANSRPTGRATLLSRVEGLDLERPFVLHVGSNLRMKNREGVLRIFALTKNDWNGQLVFAGLETDSGIAFVRRRNSA